MSHILGKKEERMLADKVYYLNKIIHGVDWYWAIELPEYFFPEHPVGSVLGRAVYGDYLVIYQGVTIGGNYSIKEKMIVYPVIGKYVICYSDAKIVGNTTIGNKVIIGANCYIKDERIPDYSVVHGSSPNLSVCTYNEDTINEYFKNAWKIV